jgi:small subunit ribosomal protein S6e
MQIVYSDRKTGKTGQADVPKDREAQLVGKRMGDIIDGAIAGLDGFKLKLTGMSDSAGAPSRSEIEGTRKATPLLGYGVGMRYRGKGFRSRRSVRGNTVSNDTVQLNTVIEEYGSKPLEELFKVKEKKDEKS